MKCVLLAAVIIQAVIGVQGAFSVEPKALNTVPVGDSVVLECITTRKSFCGWRFFSASRRTDIYNDNLPLEDRGIRGRVLYYPTTDCTIIIDSVERRHNGTYICKPAGPSGMVSFSQPADIIVVDPVRASASQPTEAVITSTVMGILVLLWA